MPLTSATADAVQSGLIALKHCWSVSRQPGKQPAAAGPGQVGAWLAGPSSAAVFSAVLDKKVLSSMVAADARPPPAEMGEVVEKVMVNGGRAGDAGAAPL